MSTVGLKINWLLLWVVVCLCHFAFYSLGWGHIPGPVVVALHLSSRFVCGRSLQIRCDPLKYTIFGQLTLRKIMEIVANT